jgi:phage gpG-like protein
MVASRRVLLRSVSRSLRSHNDHVVLAGERVKYRSRQALATTGMTFLLQGKSYE